MIELLQNLVKIKSISPNDFGCFDLIEDELSELGFNCERINYLNVENLYATIGNSGKLFCFLGHTDVVPSGPEENWKYPPFSATIEDDLLYGRGVADMKGSVAAFIEASKDFLSFSKDLNFRLAILLTSNEEGTSEDGFIDKIIENMIKDNEIIDFCLVGEPTSSKKIADCARIGRRGSLGGHLKIYGRQGHIAYPEKIINPISKSGDLISKLSSKVWDKGNEAFDPTSFQISNIKSGTGAHNVVPGELELTFNFRFSPESNEKTLKLKFESLLNDLDINYDIVWDLNGTPYYTKNGLFRSIVSDSIKEITGYLPEFNTKGGTSDGRFIAKMNAEIIELGPVNKSIHQINEHIKISELLTLKEIYSNILSKVNQAS
tara:strand:- start:2860 stop:3987 length:1128 start_codon:yes stop_codon:yes gene_type:complete